MPYGLNKKIKTWVVKPSGSETLKRLGADVSKDIPSEVVMGRVGRETVLLKSGEIYPVARQTIVPFVNAAAKLGHPVTINTRGLTIHEISEITGAMPKENAEIQITLPSGLELKGAIIIKGRK